MGYTGKTVDYLSTPVANDGFFSDFILSDLQEGYRIPAEYEEGTVIEHLVLAITEINESLTEKKVAWVSQGYATLDAVPSGKINNVSVLVINYRRAVLAKAKYLLLQQYMSMYSRESAEHLGKLPDDWLSESNAALRAITGTRSRIGVDSL